MKRGLEWSDVRAVLDEFGIKYEVGGYGFTILATVMHGYRDDAEDWRVRCGSGIGGRGGHWMLVQVKSGDAISAAVSSKVALRRAIREHLAGPVPSPQHRERYYATKHSTKFQSGHYIWKLKSYE